jgi:ABC-type nitrate/sulfonate/bicarbonate transport system permease component
MLKNYIGAAVLLVGGWYLAAWAGDIPEQYFPTPLPVLKALITNLSDPDVLRQEALTLGRAITGVFLAISFGLALALAADRFVLVRQALQPVSELLRPIPAAAIVPITVFVFGFGVKFFLFVVTFVCLWPVYLNAAASLRGVNEVLLLTGRSFGCSASQLLWGVKLPAALPEIFVGIRLAAAHSLIAVIVSEMLTGRDGIGGLLFQRAFAIRVSDVFALTLLCGMNGLLFNQVFALIRERLVGWQTRMGTG